MNSDRCPLCAQTDTIMRFTVRGYPVRDCLKCGHRFAGLVIGSDHVGRVYDDRYFDGGGAGYADYGAEAELLTALGRRYADSVARHGLFPPGRMLDVGAASGFILAGWVTAGWCGIGIEPNATMVARARNQTGLDVRHGTGEAMPNGAEAISGKFDLIAMMQVIAHFHNPRLALSNLLALTRPGGYWLIETWDRRSLCARMSGRYWHEYSPPSVLHWYSRQGLSELVASYGMRVVAHGRPRKFLLGAHAKSLLTHTLGDHAPGRWLKPVTRLIPAEMRIPYLGDDLFWLLCRRN